MSPETDFDYESAIWGEDAVHPSDPSFAGYRLATLLEILPATGKVLDLGCGAARFMRGMAHARPALVTTGIDVSRRALEIAAKLTPGGEFRLLEDPAGRLPASDGEFDAAVALDLLEHVEDPAHVLAELHRVLAAGGILHLHVPCEGDALSLWRWIPGQAGPHGLKRRFGGHVQRFRRRELSSLLDAAGFDVARRRYSLHLLGNVADVAALCFIAAASRRKQEVLTTGTLTARSARRESGLSGLLNRCVRFADGLIWLEARCLSRLPSWSVHVTARKRE